MQGGAVDSVGIGSIGMPVTTVLGRKLKKIWTVDELHLTREPLGMIGFMEGATGAVEGSTLED
jgi:hypothetical protein